MTLDQARREAHVRMANALLRRVFQSFRQQEQISPAFRERFHRDNVKAERQLAWAGAEARKRVARDE